MSRRIPSLSRTPAGADDKGFRREVLPIELHVPAVNGLPGPFLDLQQDHKQVFHEEHMNARADNNRFPYSARTQTLFDVAAQRR